VNREQFQCADIVFAGLLKLYVTYVGRDQGVGSKGWGVYRGRVEASTVQDKAVALQHGARVDRYSDSCTKGHYPK
jgi:hypothetical protein